MPEPAFFFDRDGVVNQSPGPGYVLNWSDFHWMPGIFELLGEIHRQKFKVILVTNQKWVGKGLGSLSSLERIHRRMQTELESHATAFHRIYTHTGLPECPCAAKPDPQMLHLAAKENNLNLQGSWLVGDADRDIEMAQRAGVGTTVRIQGDKPETIQADYAFSDLAALRQLVAFSN